MLGPHSHLAVHRGQVVRYRPDVAGFVTMPADPGPRDWQDLADLVGPGARVALSNITTPPPPGWEIVVDMAGVQLTGERVRAAPDADAVRLDDADVPDMLDRGDIPFLHARADNTNAIRLYETLGFRLRRRTRFAAFRVPLGSRQSAGPGVEP